MEDKELLGCVLEHMHSVCDSEVAHQGQEKPDVSHVVQQIRILKLLRQLISNGLGIHSRALTVPGYQAVLDHLALEAREILQLIAHSPSVGEFEESPLDLVSPERLLTMSAGPVVLLKSWITAKIKVRAGLAMLAHNVRKNQYQTRLSAIDHSGRELLFAKQMEDIPFECLRRQEKGLIKPEDVSA